VSALGDVNGGANTGTRSVSNEWLQKLNAEATGRSRMRPCRFDHEILGRIETEIRDRAVACLRVLERTA
jgi:hypothetical protein